jgi:hypothetical protein
VPTDKPKSPKPKRGSRLGMQSPVTPRSYAGKTAGQGLAVDGNGRPTNLTPEVHAAFIADMRTHGDWPAMTAYRCGVSPVTVESWVTRGADPYAVEPYRSFVADFVSAEAEIHGKLLKVILDEALGTPKPPKEPDPMRTAVPDRAPSPAWAAWLLQHRWGYLWRLNKDTGKTNGVTVAEVADQALAKFSEERRDKARAIIAKLSSEARASARKDGFLL